MPLRDKGMMRIFPQPGKGLQGFFLMDALVGLLLLVVLLGSVFQAFQSLSLLIRGQEAALTKEWESAQGDTRFDPFY